MHGSHSNAIVMRRPDGTPMSREEVIIHRRGALKWMPVLCSNDLVHGSWWFTVGSFSMCIFAIYPLVQNQLGWYQQHDDFMPATDHDITWALLIISGAFFTLGSLAFVHAFEEPPRQAIFHNWKHAQTDELLASWLFLFASIPAIPYMFVFFTLEPGAFYFFGLIAAIVFVLASALGVVACYPKEVIKKQENYALPCCLFLCGAQMWVVKHLANDWLAGTWVMLWGNVLLTFASFVILLAAFASGNPGQIFIWLSGTISSALFMIGSAYFVSGSYPHANQFYYTTDRGRSDTISYEIYADEIGLEPVIGQRSTSQSTSSGGTVNPIHAGPLNNNSDMSLMPSKRRSVMSPPPGKSLLPQEDNEKSTQNQTTSTTLNKTQYKALNSTDLEAGTGIVLDEESIASNPLHSTANSAPKSGSNVGVELSVNANSGQNTPQSPNKTPKPNTTNNNSSNSSNSKPQTPSKGTSGGTTGGKTNKTESALTKSNLSTLPTISGVVTNPGGELSKVPSTGNLAAKNTAAQQQTQQIDFLDDDNQEDDDADV